MGQSMQNSAGRKINGFGGEGMIRRTNDAKHNQNAEKFLKEHEKINSHSLSFLGKEITTNEVKRTNERH